MVLPGNEPAKGTYILLQNLLARSSVLLFDAYTELKKAGCAPLLVIECEQFFSEAASSISEAMEQAILAERNSSARNAGKSTEKSEVWSGWATPGTHTTEDAPTAPDIPPTKSPEVSSIPSPGQPTPEPPAHHKLLIARVRNFYATKP